MTPKFFTAIIVIALVVAGLAPASPVLADANCNPQANPESAAYQACFPPTSEPPQPPQPPTNSGLHLGQVAHTVGVPASDLVQAAQDAGVEGLGTNKEATNEAIIAYIASLESESTEPEVAPAPDWLPAMPGKSDPSKWVLMFQPMPENVWGTNVFRTVWVNLQALDKRIEAQGLIDLARLPEEAVVLTHPYSSAK